MILDKPIKEFLDNLASGEPTPGGGSVAALVGATAAALVSMVCNISRKNKNTPTENIDKLNQIQQKSEQLRTYLQELVQQDVDAFDDYMSSLKLPQNTEEEKIIRQEAIEHSVEKATLVPLRIIEHSAEVLKLAKEVLPLAVKSVVSDVGIAAIMAESAMHTSMFNIEINLANCENDEFADKVFDRVDEVMDEVEDLTQEIIDAVQDIIYEI